MAKKGLQIVRIGKETTRGTVAGSFPWQPALIGSGLRPTLVNNVGRIVAYYTFPYETEHVPLGLTGGLAMQLEARRDTIKDIIETVKPGASPFDLPTLSIGHDTAGIGMERFLGSMCSALELSFSRSSQPGEGMILAATMEFLTMQRTSATGVTGTTVPTGPVFKMNAANTTFNILGVATTKLLSWRFRREIQVAAGPLIDATTRMYMESGLIVDTLEVTGQFNATSYRDAVVGATEGVISTQIGTGTTNEHFILAQGKCTFAQHQIGEEEDNVLTEQISVRTAYTGAAAPTVPTYGSLIGASTLGYP